MAKIFLFEAGEPHRRFDNREALIDDVRQNPRDYDGEYWGLTIIEGIELDLQVDFSLKEREE